MTRKGKNKMAKRILFVCMANTNRSPTFERYFKKNFPQYEVRSSGTYYGYPEPFTEKLLKWADVIYVMDLSQELFISRHFPNYTNKVKIIGISDQYDPDSPELIELIEFWVNKEFKNEKTKHKGKDFGSPER